MTGTDETRGQAFTLEGVIGAVVVLASVVLALQAVNVAPVATEGDDARDDRLETQAEDVLAIASDRDALRTTVSCVSSGGEPDLGLANPNDPLTPFGRLLNQTFAQNSDEFIVAVEYRNGDGLERERLYPGPDISAPTGAVSASRQVALYDSDPVYNRDGGECVRNSDGTTTADSDQFYIEDEGGSNVYNTARVRVIAW